MANDVLEKNQEKSYNEVFAKYSFTAEGSGAYSDEQPTLDALLPGIRLHFLRYGLFERESDTKNINAPKYEDFSKKNAVLIKDEKSEIAEVVQSNQQAENESKKFIALNEVIVMGLSQLPELDHFYVARTAVNPGYIYLINDNDPDDYYELEADENGTFQHILWEYNKDENGEYLDERAPSGSKSDYKLVKPGKKLWISYSPVQWGRDHFNKINTERLFEENGMVLIDVSGIKKGEEKKNPIPFHKVNAVYPENHSALNQLYSRLHEIQADERRQDSEGDNEVFEDMFITLHDPVGCALDISKVVERKTIEFKALIDSVQSGEQLKDAYNRISSGNLEAPRPKNLECEQLFSLALTCYQLVYNDDKAIIKYDGGSPGWFNFLDRHSLDPRPKTKTEFSYSPDGVHSYQEVPNVSHIGYGLDYKKLEGILGIKERNDARKNLLGYRDDLGKMVAGDYLKKYLENFLFNHVERVLEGRNVLLDIIDPLSYHPYKFDRHLMLQKEFVEEDKWVDFVYQVIDNNPAASLKSSSIQSSSEAFSGMDPLLALLGAPLNVDKLMSKSESISIKLAKAYKKNLKYRAQQASALKEIDGVLFESIDVRQKFVVRKLNKNLKVFGKEMFEIVDGDIWMTLEKNGVVLDPEYVKKGKYTGKRKDVLRILKESHGKDGFSFKTRKVKRKTFYDLEIKVAKDKTGDAKAAKSFKLSKIVNGRAFNGVFAFLELYNFRNAVIKVTKEGSTRKDKVYAVGSAVKLTEASVNLRIACLKASSKESKRNAGKLLATKAKPLSVVGGSITAAWCFYDAYVSMDKGDMDAGFAMIGAGVAFGVSAAASLGTIAVLGGPVGWIAALVGIGFIIVAALLADKPLETYFKNFLLCDGEAFSKDDGMSPYYYTQLILLNRAKLTDNSYHDTLMNPIDAQAKLLDHIVCKEISFSPKNASTESYTSSGTYGGGGFPVTSSVSTASRFTAKMVFSRFFSHEDQVEVVAYFYPEGVKKGVSIGMKVKRIKKVYDTNGGEALQVNFHIPNKHKDKIRLHSEVVFALRLQLDKTQNLHFPYPLKGQERYLGAKIRVRSLSAGLYISSLSQDESVTIAPLRELKTKNPW